MPALSPNVRPEDAKAGQITISLARPADWTRRVTLLRAIEDWNRNAAEYRDQLLWRRLVAIDRPPGRVENLFEPLYPPDPGEDRKEKHERDAWIEGVALLKQKIKSGDGCGLYVVDIGLASAEPKIASDAWVEAVLPEEVSFAKSQITRNQRVFAVWVGARPSEPVTLPTARVELPEERVRRTADRGGRPVRYRWSEFWTEVIRVADQSPDGLPEQRVLKGQMLTWISEKWQDQPAANTVGDKLAKLYRALEGRPGGGPRKFGGDEFWIEIVLIVARSPDGLPDKTELIKRLLEPVSPDWLNQPAENTMRTEVSKLYRALGRR